MASSDSYRPVALGLLALRSSYPLCNSYPQSTVAHRQNFLAAAEGFICIQDTTAETQSIHPTVAFIPNTIHRVRHALSISPSSPASCFHKSEVSHKRLIFFSTRVMSNHSIKAVPTKMILVAASEATHAG